MEPKGFFLIDSGGQYWQGTTDITRTIAVGELTQEQKEHFTLVLKGNIRLATAKFMYGMGGAHLDCLARGSAVERGLDFNHGTGHGVGFLLNVHEGPQNINWNSAIRPGGYVPLEEGVLISDEQVFTWKADMASVVKICSCAERERRMPTVSSWNSRS